jgi:hypothetical protein
MITKMTFTYHDIFFSFFYLVYIGLVLLGINRLLDLKHAVLASDSVLRVM